MLENIANLKSAEAVEVNRRNSFGSSFISSYDRIVGDEESKPPLRDPTGCYGKAADESKPSLFDGGGMSVDFSVGSYLQQKTPLEPEEDQKVAVKPTDEGQSRDSAQDFNSKSEPKMSLIKVPGGEYYGEVNESGQKHGQGRMIYGEKFLFPLVLLILMHTQFCAFVRKITEMNTRAHGLPTKEMVMVQLSMLRGTCMLVSIIFHRLTRLNHGS